MRKFFTELLRISPHLACENPFGGNFRTAAIRKRGENQIILRNLEEAPSRYQKIIRTHQIKKLRGEEMPIAVYAGGPASKIAAILSALPSVRKPGPLSVRFVLDGAEQSNESGSASYEHINHANALNAELDNTGLGIFVSALSRALRGEPNPDVALSANYRKVDLWANAVCLRDIPIFVGNEIHGVLQSLRHFCGRSNDHTKSRTASKYSTAILSYLEQKLGCSFRLENEVKRAIFLYFTLDHYKDSLRDNEELRRTIGLRPQSLSAEQLTQAYGSRILGRIVGADIFPENACIRHGFDQICRQEIVKLGGDYIHRQRICEIYFSKEREARAVAVGVVIENVVTGTLECLPADYLGLSLGSTATYHFGRAMTASDRIRDYLQIGLPVPYQTIATGLSAQILFRITDPSRASNLPFTGMKQTHFVEIGRTDTHVLMKLTCGGMIGLPVYSRSYGLSALASILRVLTPERGLQFEDVVCAWPCARAVNPSNNGQIVRLADNAVSRFGEGGTGMSKMGSNAQTMLDLLAIPWPADLDLRVPEHLYAHTIIDNRGAIARRL